MRWPEYPLQRESWSGVRSYTHCVHINCVVHNGMVPSPYVHVCGIVLYIRVCAYKCTYLWRVDKCSLQFGHSCNASIEVSLDVFPQLLTTISKRCLTMCVNTGMYTYVRIYTILVLTRHCWFEALVVGIYWASHQYQTPPPSCRTGLGYKETLWKGPQPFVRHTLLLETLE